MPFDGCPPDGKYPGDDSPVVWGVCTHAFHLQCINRCVYVSVGVGGWVGGGGGVPVGERGTWRAPC